MFKQSLFNLNSLGIIWSGTTALKSFIINFEQVCYEIFFSLKWLFQVFLPVVVGVKTILWIWSPG